MQFLGQHALIAILVHLLFITLTWWALQALNYEALLKKGKVVQARVLLILLTIAIGSAVSSFFLDYLGYSNSLTYLLK
ncbi:DUF1146 family protein [Ectobacillus ponti]|uniref:DUF1146 family protein n=1 Tax=Ectobacillus ponti TaxID=2961894 RepID=A0AA41X2S4_9BACI|nr:DUF1146 family protein [Ectobacillus ponti]MCP8967889.1 DUF1146 family protein [Ectobacillus ponti]